MDGPAELTPVAARRWLVVWIQLRRAEQVALLPNRRSGPTAARDTPSRQLQSGRMVFRKRGTAAEVHMPEGRAVRDPVGAAEALLDARRQIWFRRPPLAVDSRRPSLTPTRPGAVMTFPAAPRLGSPRSAAQC